MNNIFKNLCSAPTCINTSKIFASGRWWPQPTIGHMALYSSTSSSSEAKTVSVTSSCRRNVKNAFDANIGIYWGKNDELNAYMPFKPEDGQVNIIKAQIESVSLALRQAIYERKLTHVTIHTDSDFVVKVIQNYLRNWRTNNYLKLDGTPVKNRETIEELDRLLQQINAKVEYVPFLTSNGNNVFNRLKEEGVLPQDKEVYTPPDEDLFELSTTEKEISGPTVYVAGKLANSGKKDFKTAGYGVHWAGEESSDHCGRYGETPITLYRAQLTGILFALRQAIGRELKGVNIVTDSGMFLKHFKNKWQKRDGNPVANYPLYKKILRCTEKIDVKFTYVPMEIKNAEMEKALQCAEDGMAYPVLTKEQMEELARPMQINEAPLQESDPK